LPVDIYFCRRCKNVFDHVTFLRSTFFYFHNFFIL